LSTDVPDGATQRHSRMMELLTFINLAEPQGATITQIQSYMLTVFGLKFRTTSEMVGNWPFQALSSLMDTASTTSRRNSRPS
jgi:hypothetical protein